MALATRCPHCQTAFRVASDQLKLRAGLVRCGTCKEIFNGIENLLHPDEDINAAVNAPAGATVSRWPAPKPSQDNVASPVHPAAPTFAVPATAPSSGTVRRDTRTRAEKSDNTLFQELIAEVDHPPPPAAREPEPAAPAIPAKSGYAASYAPVQLAPLVRTPGSILAGLGAVRADPPPFAPNPISADTAPQDRPADSSHREESSSVDGGVAQDNASLWQAATSDFDEDATYFPGTLGAVPANQVQPDLEQVRQHSHEESREDGHEDDHESIDEAAHVFELDRNDPSTGTGQASMSPLPGLLRPSRIDDDHAAPAPDGMAHDALAIEPDAVASAIHTASAAATHVPPIKAVGDAETADDDLPDFVSQDIRRQGLQRTVRPLLYVAAVLLALLLLGQLAYAFRTAIAANFPQTRPVLDDACRLIGCSVGLPMQIDSVSIESSDFQPLADKRDQFILNVLLRNRSSTVQAWPSIELTLNDSTDKIVARRVIGPRDYLPAGASTAKGFGAGSEQPIRLVFELARLTASGYRVYLFYP